MQNQFTDESLAGDNCWHKRFSSVSYMWYQLILLRFSKLISAFCGHLANASKKKAIYIKKN